jgi:hypothetical protein
MSEIYRAKEAFTFNGKNGVPRVFTAGVLISSDDPDYKGKEHLFEPVEVAAARPVARASGVEDASAEPNVKRSVSTTKPVYGATHPPKPGAQATKRQPRKTEE